MCFFNSHKRRVGEAKQIKISLPMMATSDVTPNIGQC